MPHREHRPLPKPHDPHRDAIHARRCRTPQPLDRIPRRPPPRENLREAAPPPRPSLWRHPCHGRLHCHACRLGLRQGREGARGRRQQAPPPPLRRGRGPRGGGGGGAGAHRGACPRLRRREQLHARLPLLHHPRHPHRRHRLLLRRRRRRHGHRLLSRRRGLLPDPPPPRRRTPHRRARLGGPDRHRPALPRALRRVVRQPPPPLGPRPPRPHGHLPLRQHCLHRTLHKPKGLRCPPLHGALV
mmetsp:Transcript_43045/g.107718  ORF Transcript_43045/g.107718 Transcript_43045/m.107718 type:complete len:243 (+) Transcript_43045:487-1215(+)